MAEYEGVVCAFCGSLCDDITLKVEDNAIVSMTGGCAIGRKRFLSPPEANAPLVKGRETGLDQAIDAAVRILSSARYPLIYGLSSTTAEAQAAAVRLAETLGATIDSTSSVCHGPGTIARQMLGIPTCTLGEVRNRADVVLFWGCNPVEAHPRHFGRYSVQARGWKTPEGRQNRTLIAVDVRKTLTAKMADVFLQVEPNSDFEVLTALRALINGANLTGDTFGGVPRSQLEQAAQTLLGAKYGVILFGMGLTMSSGCQHNAYQALMLARDLNDHTAFAVIPMRGHGNVTGAETVMTWLTGYPFAVNFSRGYPRYSPGEFSAVDVLVRDEADAALVVASDPAATFPAAAADRFAQISTIVIDPQFSATAQMAQVYIPSASAGIAASGTAYRMDGVPLPLRKLVDSEYPDDRQILNRIEEGVRQCST
ncbi:MAG: formylmethanofuran dehydrogenase subunit B [Bacillota bacterium]